MDDTTADTFFAHSMEDRPLEDWQLLRDHLEGVAGLARGFTEAFASKHWGHRAGLWHDLGKYRREFQERIRGAQIKADHAVVGALLAQGLGENDTDLRGIVLAFVIAGHHGGLSNLRQGEKPKPLMPRLSEQRSLLEETLPWVPPDFRELPLPELPERFQQGTRTAHDRQELSRSLELWIRFLFSALVDADFLDTERFYHGERRDLAKAGFEALPVLRGRLDAEVDKLAAGSTPGPVNEVRAEVLAACRGAAEAQPGFFSLTVPTGGGKTLAGMSFALRHAVRHELRRVIAVIPFTSIIEQNAAVYRDALGEDQVIEHHSNLDPEEETERNRLASENWDAPVIVTTGVQFFESLFARWPSRCRKLHNIVRSVIFLDEIQTMPVDFQIPILEVMRELVEHYGCSIVLSTATQPAFDHHPEELPHGLRGVREIIPKPAALTHRLRRFDVTWPVHDEEPATWETLSEELVEEKRVLAIVHRRQDARELAELLPDEGRFHLSALMCAAHRKAVLDRIRTVLEHEGTTCRLISTQLVEAGVDVDFPVVYRALGGLDSMVQAGGRCNREGRLDRGRLVVFRAPTEPPPGTPRKGLETMESLLRRRGEALDPTRPEVIRQYFRELFGKSEGDVNGVQALREAFNFFDVANKTRLISDHSAPVVVPYGDAENRLDDLRRKGPSRDRLRALQPYIVGIPPRKLDAFRGVGAVESVQDTVYALHPAYQHLYDAVFGLKLDDSAVADPSALMV